MALVISFGGKTPQVAAGAWVAPNATLIGDVTIAAGASVFYGAVLRGDIAPIVLGEGSNLQDNVIVHTEVAVPTIIGRNVGVGHGAIIHSATIHDGALIGMGALLLSNSVIGAGALVAAGALVREGQEVPAQHLAVGVPAKVRGLLTDEEQQRVARNAVEYQKYAAQHSQETAATSFVELTTSIDSADGARQLSDGAVAKRLAACAQITGPIISTYWWAGNLETVREWRITFKTSATNIGGLTEYVHQNHPYQVPEISQTTVSATNPAYANWVISETATPPL